ncbi:MAG: cytochrome [Verrucomicrobiaceae bacterium]|nr:cytochrome [Verrucomicrobiaceae bacterium]
MNAITSDIPAHVPLELVREDFPFVMGMTTTENPFKTMVPAIHEGPEIIYSTNFYPGYGPAWIPRRLEDLQALYLDTENFSSQGFSPFAMLIGENWNLLPAEMDPPQHTAYRTLLNPLFTPRKMQSLDDKVRLAAREFIAAFKDRGECEFMNEFAFRFPIVVFLDLMGLPRDRMEQFLEWENGLLHSMDIEGIIAATKSVCAYLREVIEDRRQNPVDDLVSFGVTAEIDGRKLNDDELMGFCFNLFIGGLDTVSTNIAWQTRHLAENLQDQRRLREHPELISSALEEMYRRYSAVTTFRTCIKETKIRGVTIMPGDKVAMPTTLANTDPLAWDKPFEVDLDRAPRHITFAYGIHRCIGAPLARRESAIALEELFSALPEFRIAEGAEIITELGPILQPRNLPLAWGEKRAAKVAPVKVETAVENVPEGKAVESSVASISQFLSNKLAAMEPFGKTIKLLLDGNAIVLDGNTNPPALHRDDVETEFTVIASLENFAKVLNKKLNPQIAMATGKIKFKGDMLAVMALSKLL